jgi:citrate lyase beta subunit
MTHNDNINPLELGASLYVPATRNDLIAIGQGQQIPNLRSLIFCTEDSILENLVPQALEQIRLTLPYLEHPMLRFVRARNPIILEQLLCIKHIDRITGFVLPKVTASNLVDYLEAIRRVGLGFGFQYMITVETKDAFSVSQMERLRDLLLASELPVLSIRIGGNDLLNLLSMRRQRGITAYQTPLGQIINQLIMIFRPFGFHISAPVYDYTNDPETLALETQLDVQNGIIGKTAIHPRQIPIIEAAYQVRSDDVYAAREILKPNAPAVFRIGDQMCEPATHRNWAKHMLLQAQIYGEVPSPNFRKEIHEPI